MIPESKAYLEVVEQIREDHIAEARKLVQNEEIQKGLIDHIEEECEKLSSFLSATQVRRPFKLLETG